MVVVGGATSCHMRIISKASNNSKKKNGNNKKRRRSVFAIAIALALFLLSSTIVTGAVNNNNYLMGNIIEQAYATHESFTGGFVCPVGAPECQTHIDN